MSKVEIELHTIATYNNKRYELQDVLNVLLNENLKSQQRIDKAIEYVKEHRNYAHTIDIDELLEILEGGEDNR